MRLAVQIAANAKKTEVVGAQGDVLKIRLQAQPIDGKANEALIRWLAQTFGVARSAVVLTHGHTNKRKLVDIRSQLLTPEMAVHKLTAHLGEGA